MKYCLELTLLGLQAAEILAKDGISAEVRVIIDFLELGCSQPLLRKYVFDIERAIVDHIN